MVSVAFKNMTIGLPDVPGMRAYGRVRRENPGAGPHPRTFTTVLSALSI